MEELEPWEYRIKEINQQINKIKNSKYKKCLYCGKRLYKTDKKKFIKLCLSCKKLSVF